MAKYVGRPVPLQEVEAEQVGIGAQSHPQGTRSARPGEWVVTDLNTRQVYIFSNEEFLKTYEGPLPEPEVVEVEAPPIGASVGATTEVTTAAPTLPIAEALAVAKANPEADSLEVTHPVIGPSPTPPGTESLMPPEPGTPPIEVTGITFQKA